MPSPFQTASGRRKIVYLGLILGLFVVNTFFWRGVASPLTDNKPPKWTVHAGGLLSVIGEATPRQKKVLTTNSPRIRPR